MNQTILRIASAVMLVLLLAVAPVGAHAQGKANPEIDENAMSILKRMANFLSRTQGFSVTAEIGYDAVQNSGQKIEFGSTREITIRRPDRVRMDVQDRDGSKSGFIFDGKDISVFNTKPNVYAIASKPGTLDAAFDYFTEQLDMLLPLSNLFSSDLPKVLPDMVGSIRYVDESTIAGVPCDHLAARNEKVDFQIWISKGDKPQPRRLLITYRHEEGQPQFWANFVEWNLSPQIPDSLFAFTPLKGAEKIPFHGLFGAGCTYLNFRHGHAV